MKRPLPARPGRRVRGSTTGRPLTDNGSELLQVFSPLSRFATRWAELINQPDDESA
jgi:hypothetical protein